MTFIIGSSPSKGWGYKSWVVDWHFTWEAQRIFIENVFLFKEKPYKNSDFIIISTPTNYDPEKNFFDTSSIESVIKLIKEVGSKATIVIKSTVPVGYTERIVKEFDLDNLLFSPEFLREGHALYDNLYPSRIVVSYPKNFPALKEKASQFAGLLLQGAEKKDVPVLKINDNVKMQH